MSHRILGFGLIGTGMIAGRHAQVIAGLDGARLVGVAGRTPESAGAFAARHHAPFSTDRVAELVARPDIDVVCIATPSGAHLDGALPAIAAGKHVIVEKPVEITVARSDRMLAAAARAGVRVAPVFQARFNDGARLLRSALDAGRFGRLVIARADVKWHRAASYYQGWKGTLALDGGGALMNQGIHAVDLLRWFAGPADETFAWKTRRVHTGIEAEDTVCATVRFRSGALGTIEASTAVWPGWSRRIELCGEHGSATLEDDRITRWDFRSAGPEDDAVRAAGASGGSGAADPAAISNEGHRRQFEDIVAALRENRPLAIEGREARDVVALVEAVYASAEAGLPVKIP
jgi:UDP-N-acetyl-2-amino-2-deoxyglucuronate dehydrogenase